MEPKQVNKTNLLSFIDREINGFDKLISRTFGWKKEWIEQLQGRKLMFEFLKARIEEGKFDLK